MGVPADTSPYGAQTLMGPCWPNTDEDALAAAAESFEQLAMHLTGVVVPQLHGQWTTLANSWSGGAATAALGEASTIINGHEINAAQASAIAVKLRTMEASVAKTKAMVNATAQETEHECEAIEASPFQNKEELLQSRIRLGQSQNMADVMAATTELANNLGVPAVNPSAMPIPPGGAPGAGQVGDASQAGGQGAQQAVQMVTQMASQVGQLPQQLGKLAGGGQGLQQLTQPLQQISTMFGNVGKGGVGASPFAAFTNHPAAGGSGAAAGAGLMRAASLPGGGGSSPQTPLLAKLVGKTKPSATAVEEGAAAGGTTAAGVAPVGAAGGATGGMGGMGMMGARETSGGSRAGLAVPMPLEHDLSEDDVDEDW
jgi:hypothetical protein